MLISELIRELQKVRSKEGDIEVTCTASTLNDGHGGGIPDVCESTVETLVIVKGAPLGRGGDCPTRVRLYL